MTSSEDFEKFEKIGLEIIELLGLKVNKIGRVDTGWGDKTPTGLARTLKRIIEKVKP